MDRALRMGMVGGGRGAFIGAVHRIAAQMDGRIELVCGAFSSTRQKSKESGQDLLLREDRCYPAYRDMFRKEAKLPDDERMDFVSIVTPNNMHYPVAMAALDAGFHVVCDKPMTVSTEEARNLAKKLRASGLHFCLTHNYTGYPLVKEARELITSGQMGQVRRVVAEYAQGWLAVRQETSGSKQAIWRTDPRRAGISCCLADIGTHCENLIAYVTGHAITEVCADLNTFVKGRALDDDASLLIRLANGARGVLWASQIAVGRENGLCLRVFAEKGSVEWHQEEPNTLVVDWLDRPRELRRPATTTIGDAALAASRLPVGHPEGYLEAFANIYSAFAKSLTDVIDGNALPEADYGYPTIEEGMRGVAFLEAAVQSSTSDNKWVEVA